MFPNIERCAEPFKNIDLVWLIATHTGRAIVVGSFMVSGYAHRQSLQ
jgi:hypothetical protein